MSFIVYDADTTLITVKPKNYATGFETAAAASAAITRAKKQGKDTSNWKIAESKEFFEKIEKKEIRKGVVFAEGKTFEVGVNTSWTSGPWSESYWSN